MKTTTLEREDELRAESEVDQPRHEREPAPAHEEIAKLAYRYWQERGSPDGSPDDDWRRAERELRARR